MGLRRRLGVVVGVDPNNKAESPKSSLKSPQGRDPSKPFAGFPDPVLGAVTPCLSTFGENCPRFPSFLSKMTFD